ncbi:MAG: glycosyltransferase family 4 protein [Gammaproteobacteria bacterium]|nr:glycosyltransferase family 4 protein [Gammaproteobacteria bacterium]
MNILSINKFYWLKGGSETVYFGEKNLLEKHGHTVIPFSMQDKSNFPSEYSKFFVRNIDYENAGLREKIISAGRIIYSFEARKKMTELLQNVQIDIAHFHIFQHQISPSVFDPLRKAGIPIVLSLHDLKPICPNYKMYTQGHICEKCMGGKFYNCTLNKCTKNSTGKSLVNTIEMYFHHIAGYYDMVDRFIAISSFHKQKMIEFGFPSEKFSYIPNFIDLQEYPVPNLDKEYILYFGRLSDDKGLDTLLEASTHRKDIPLVIAGTGPHEKHLKQKAQDLGLSNVKFVGYKSGGELTNLIGNTSFTILPSELYENCPMTILESMAMGKPVIGARLGGIPELINEGIDGYTFEKGNSEELARKIEYLWSNKEKRIELGQAGRKKIEERHTPEHHYDLLMKTYSNVISAKNN